MSQAHPQEKPPLVGRLFPLKLIAGLPMAASTMDQAWERLLDNYHRANQPLDVHFITAHTIAEAESSDALRKIFLDGAILLPDSRWIPRLAIGGSPRLTQVRGPDFFRYVLDKTPDSDVSHFFIAPRADVQKALASTLQSRYATVKQAGSFVAPMRPLTSQELDKLADRINELGQPITWVGVGTPAQNVLANELRKRGVRLVIGVGAAFEFLAGLKKEAPAWISKAGLEWLYRFVQEPRRLFKRYVIGNMVFLYSMIKHAPHQKTQLTA